MLTRPRDTTIAPPRLAIWRQRLIQASLLVMVATGVLWLWAEYAWPSEAAALEPHEVRNFAMRLHVLAALAFVFMVGVLLDTHIRLAWRHKRNRGTGLAVLLVALLLTVSGYGLWYFHGDLLRAATEWLHWIVGFLSPLLLWLHARTGQRSRPPAAGATTGDAPRRRLENRGTRGT